MSNLNNITSFNDFKNRKINEGFDGRGNVSGGADFFEDAKKTFVGGIIDKLSSYIKKQVYKKMLRNLAYRYSEELLAGVLKYSQDNNVAISNDMSFSIRKEENDKNEEFVVISKGDIVRKISDKIEVKDSIKYKDIDKTIEDGDYYLSNNSKINIVKGIIEKIEVIEKKSDTNKEEDDNNGEYTFKFNDKDYKVIIPTKEIKVDADIYGYDVNGISGSTLVDGDYYYKKLVITLHDSKIKDIVDTENDVNNNTNKFSYKINYINKDKKLRDATLKIDNNTFNIGSDVKIYIISNNKEVELTNIKVKWILSFYNNKQYKFIHINTENKIDIVYNYNSIVNIINGKEKIKTNDAKNIEAIVSLFFSADDITKLKNILIMNDKNTDVKTNIKQPKKNVNVKQTDNTLVENEDLYIDDTSFVMINEGLLNFNLDKFNNKLTNTKLSDDLSSDLSKSFGQVNLKDLNNTNLDKTKVGECVNVSNIIYLQIKAEQTFLSKTDNKTNENMKRYWESLIQSVKKHYEKYINVDLVDPFKLRNELDKIRNNNDNISGYNRGNFKPTLSTNNSALDINNVVGGTLATDILKASEFKNTIKDEHGAMIILNIMLSKDSYVACICIGNTIGSKGQISYKILALVDILSLQKEKKDKNTDIDEATLNKYTYFFRKPLTDTNNVFGVFMKRFGFFDKSKVFGDKKVSENYFITNSNNTIKTKIHYIPVSLHTKKELSMSYMNNDTFKEDLIKEIDFKITDKKTNNNNYVAYDNNHVIYNFNDKLYQLSTSSKYYNYFNKVNNTSTSLYYFRDILDKFINYKFKKQ